LSESAYLPEEEGKKREEADFYQKGRQAQTSAGFKPSQEKRGKKRGKKKRRAPYPAREGG